MKLLSRFKLAIQKLLAKQPTNSDTMTDSDRVARLERNYIVLLKKVLAMDGIKLVTTTGHSSRSQNLDAKIFQTATDERSNGLNEYKPTLH